MIRMSRPIACMQNGQLSTEDVYRNSYPFPSASCAGVDAALCLAKQLQPNQFCRVQRHICKRKESLAVAHKNLPDSSHPHQCGLLSHCAA